MLDIITRNISTMSQIVRKRSFVDPITGQQLEEENPIATSKWFKDTEKQHRVEAKIIQITKIIVLAMFVLTLIAFFIIIIYTSDDLFIDPSTYKAKVNVLRSIEKRYVNEKGKGCDIPKLDPFSRELSMHVYDRHMMVKADCGQPDWVECSLTSCGITLTSLLDQGVRCIYQDVFYVDDYTNGHSLAAIRNGHETYDLYSSDHVNVACALSHSVYNKSLGRLSPSWVGVKAGFRADVSRVSPKPERVDGINVITIGLEAVSKNLFMKQLPKSYAYLKKNMNAVFMRGYSIVGYTKKEALLPYLSGRSIWGFPGKVDLNRDEFIFYFARRDGYRTLFFENPPEATLAEGTTKGFALQPADHYLRPFVKESNHDLCFTDTPQYKWMLDRTLEFLKLDGKKFGFTFISNWIHYTPSINKTESLLEFLRVFKRNGHMKNTMLVVMSDHGPKFKMPTYEGELEERLPLLAIVLPEKLLKRRPEVLATLRANADALTTPFDMHTTMLDAMGLWSWRNTFKIKDAELTRAVSLLRPIPHNRTCSEAGIESKYCACLNWRDLPTSDLIYQHSAKALLNHINEITKDHRNLCASRTLVSIEWVLKHEVNPEILADHWKVPWDLYQTRIVVSPGDDIFEGTVKYLKQKNKFIVDAYQVFRKNMDNHKSECINFKTPATAILKKYCYCK